MCKRHKGVFPGYELATVLPSPRKFYELARYAEEFGLRTCVESGTWRGDTTARLSAELCDRVVTIELSPAHASAARARFADDPSVLVLEGDSGALLAGPEFQPAAMPEPALFFLDGHWSWGNTALGAAADGGETPILAELAAIFASDHARRSAIVIDDSRMFLGFDHPGCAARGASCYPSVRDVAELVCASRAGPGLRVYVRRDQIVVVNSNVTIPEW